MYSLHLIHDYLIRILDNYNVYTSKLLKSLIKMYQQHFKLSRRIRYTYF